jgi:hypothetical protein
MEAEGALNGSLPSAYYLAIYLLQANHSLNEISDEFKATYIDYLAHLEFDDFAHWTDEEYAYLKSLGT